MEPDTVLVRFGEVALKSDPVRRRFVHKLLSDIEYFLEKNKISYDRIRRERGRVFVDTKNSEAALIISKVFGVVSTSPAITTDPVLNRIKETALGFSKILKDAKTFAIRARRAGRDYPFTSKDLEREVGDLILKEIPELQVDLDDPERTIYIEVRPDKAYIFSKKIEGVGGLPLGTQGKVVLLVNGRDSLVAGWLTMRRGCSLVPVCFDKKTLKGVKKLREWSSEKFRVNIPYQKSLEKLREYPEVFQLLDLRLKYRVCGKIAKEEKAFALVTGGCLDLGAIKIANSVIDLPVFRPLIGFKKKEISNIAKKIRVIGLPEKELGPFELDINQIRKAEDEIVIERLVEKEVENSEVTEI